MRGNETQPRYVFTDGIVQRDLGSPETPWELSSLGRRVLMQELLWFKTKEQRAQPLPQEIFQPPDSLLGIVTFLSQGSVLLLDWMTRLCNAWDFKQVASEFSFAFLFPRNQHVSTWNRHLGCSGGWALWSAGAELAENLPRWNSVLKKTTLNPTTCKSL